MLVPDNQIKSKSLEQDAVCNNVQQGKIQAKGAGGRSALANLNFVRFLAAKGYDFRTSFFSFFFLSVLFSVSASKAGKT